MRFSSQYLTYMRSPEWQARRAKSLRLAGNKCQVCGRKGVRLECHHNSYERLGAERDNDLIMLCKSCHVFITWFLRLRRWLDKKG